MRDADLFLRLGVALVLGLLVGMERERSASQIAGVRTFALLTLFGALCAVLAREMGSALFVGAGLIGMAALVWVGNRAPDRPDERPGVTTEAAMLLMYGVGAMALLGPLSVAVALGGATAVLLHLKPQMHRFITRLEPEEARAIMRFALVSAVILPVLPDKTYDPYGALNPRHIWMMVVLIVGMNLVGYLLHKVYGQRAGALLGGAVGGLISSTATTMSASRRAAGADGPAARVAAGVIGVASLVLFGRMLVEVGAVAPGFLRAASVPAAGMALATALGTLIVWRSRREQGEHRDTEPVNPAELKAALIFAGVYGLVLLLTAAGKKHLGDAALYPLAAISGVTDMDAITLSVSRMVHEGALQPTSAWRYLTVAAMSNTVFKAGIVVMIGSRALALRVGLIFGATLLAGALLLALPLEDWGWMGAPGGVEAPAPAGGAADSAGSPG